MTLLTIVQNVCDQVGVPRADDVAGSQDTLYRQMLTLLNTEAKSLARRTAWQELNVEATFTSVADELQGPLTTIAPGFNYIINHTMWDRTDQERINGPLTEDDWQLFKASSVAGPYQDFRIKNNSLYMYPPPPAGHDMVFEYMTTYPVTSNGGTNKAAFTLNDDISRLDEWLLELGLIWRFLKAKGLDYSEEKRTCEIEQLNSIARNGGKPRLDIGTGETPKPGILLPEGSWNV